MSLPPPSEARAQVARWLRPHRGAVVASVVLAGLASLLEVASIGLVAPLLLAGEEGLLPALGPLSALVSPLEAWAPGARRAALVLAILGGMAARGLAAWGAAALRESVASRVHGEARRRVLDRLSRAPLAWLSARAIGEHQALLVHETERLAGAARHRVQEVAATVMAVAFAALLFVLAPSLTLCAVALLGAFALLLRLLRRPIERHAHRMRDEAGRVAGTLHETFGSLPLLRSLGRTDDATARFSAADRAFRAADVRQRRALEAVVPVSEFAGAVVLVAILWLGTAVLPIGGGASPVLLLPYSFLFYRLLPRWLAIGAARAGLAGTASAAPAIERFLDSAETAPEPEGGLAPPALPPRVVFEGVRFRHAPGAPWVLDGLDLVLEPGTTTALVGASGAGKSTVVDLLLGLRRPTEGRVTVDGVDLREVAGDAWRRRLGYVPQDPVLFHRSVRENLLLAAPRATGDAIDRSLDLAAARFVDDLPDGLDTVLCDRGTRLSGGERQRLCVARALVSDPTVVVFDEATSQLDAESERAVAEAVARAAASRTALVVAHRLSTVRRADRIVVLEDGRAVESGSHDDLVARDGRYARLARAAG
jgi:ABC-type multidrug transport system fused ATPase/permease subunit